MQPHPGLVRLRAREDIEQRTPAWYEARRGLLTASDVAAALGIRPFKSYKGDPRADALTKKLDNHPFSNVYCAHGQKWEDAARDLAMSALGDVAFDFGLLVHPTEPWLAASPDGVTLTGRCIEIKCPLSRKIVPGEVPHHYVPQIQTQMEVCDLDSTVFIQFKPAEITKTGSYELDIVVVERDRQWFAEHRDAMRAFWEEYTARRATHVPAPLPPPPACIVRDDLYS
jgi:putative phage-type endonuclease